MKNFRQFCEESELSIPQLCIYITDNMTKGIDNEKLYLQIVKKLKQLGNTKKAEIILGLLSQPNTNTKDYLNRAAISGGNGLMQFKHGNNKCAPRLVIKFKFNDIPDNSLKYDLKHIVFNRYIKFDFNYDNLEVTIYPEIETYFCINNIFLKQIGAQQYFTDNQIELKMLNLGGVLIDLSDGKKEKSFTDYNYRHVLRETLKSIWGKHMEVVKDVMNGGPLVKTDCENYADILELHQKYADLPEVI